MTTHAMMKLAKMALLALFLVQQTKLNAEQPPVGGLKTGDQHEIELSSEPSASSPLLEIELIPRTTMPEITGSSSLIALAEVTEANVTERNDCGVISTAYRFGIVEVWKGSAGAEIELVNLGGLLADGRGMDTGESYRLEIGATYIICLRPGYRNSVLPFLRIFQITDALIAEEDGYGIEGFTAEGAMIYSKEPVTASLRYLSESTPSIDSYQASDPFILEGQAKIEREKRQIVSKSATVKSFRTLLGGGVR